MTTWLLCQISVACGVGNMLPARSDLVWGARVPSANVAIVATGHYARPENPIRVRLGVRPRTAMGIMVRVRATFRVC